MLRLYQEKGRRSQIKGRKTICGERRGWSSTEPGNENEGRTSTPVLLILSGGTSVRRRKSPRERSNKKKSLLVFSNKLACGERGKASARGGGKEDKKQ